MVINSNVRSWFRVVCSILETVFLLPRCHILQFLYIFGCIYGSVLISVLDKRQVRLRSKVALLQQPAFLWVNAKKNISGHPGPNAKKVFADDKTDNPRARMLVKLSII